MLASSIVGLLGLATLGLALPVDATQPTLPTGSEPGVTVVAVVTMADPAHPTKTSSAGSATDDGITIIAVTTMNAPASSIATSTPAVLQEDVTDLSVKRETQEAADCYTNCYARYDICMKTGQTTDYCRLYYRLCRGGCQGSNRKTNGDDTAISSDATPPLKRQSQESKECEFDCVAHFQICIKGKHDRKYCRDHFNLCYAGCPHSKAKRNRESSPAAGLVEKEPSHEGHPVKRQTTWRECFNVCNDQYIQCIRGGHPEPWCYGPYVLCLTHCREAYPPEKFKARSEATPCVDCDNQYRACLDVTPNWEDQFTNCASPYKQCKYRNGCRDPIEKRAEAKTCEDCDREYNTCVDNRQFWQPLDQTCGRPYRKCRVEHLCD